MAKYKSFDNSKNKIQELWNITESNEISEKKLRKLSVNFQPNAFRKKIVSISIASNVNLNLDIAGTVHYEILLKNFPDWAVPMTRLFPILTTSEAFDINDPTNNFISSFVYGFKKENDNDYILKINIIGLLIQSESPFATLPLFLDLNLQLINERVYNTYQNDSKV